MKASELSESLYINSSPKSPAMKVDTRFLIYTYSFEVRTFLSKQHQHRKSFLLNLPTSSL